MTDKERIEAIMKASHMNNTTFVSTTGINGASLSQILNGKSRPTLDVLRKIQDAFPRINPAWLFVGEGDMYLPSPDEDDNATTTETNNINVSAADTPAPSPLASDYTQPSQPAAQPQSAAVSQLDLQTVVTKVVDQIQKPQRKIVEVRIFFDDGTYEVFGGK